MSCACILDESLGSTVCGLELTSSTFGSMLLRLLRSEPRCETRETASTTNEGRFTAACTAVTAVMTEVRECRRLSVEAIDKRRWLSGEVALGAPSTASSSAGTRELALFFFPRSSFSGDVVTARARGCDSDGSR